MATLVERARKKEGVSRPRLDPCFFFFSYNVHNRQAGRIKTPFACRKSVYKRFCMKKGFTLIELLVVVLIIGILSAVALPQYEKAVVKSRVATIMPILTSIREAQEVYYLANGQYATDGAELDIAMPSSCTWLSNRWDTAGRNLFTCGKHFVVDVKSGLVENAGAGASYCPDSTTNWPNCYNKREFFIIQKFLNATDDAGKHYCQFYNSQGETVCKSLTGKSSPESSNKYYF